MGQRDGQGRGASLGESALLEEARLARIRNFESAKLKVNDNKGNPIEIAAVVVRRVIDTAEAVFEVHDYENYLHVQTNRPSATSPRATPTILTTRSAFRCAATRERSRNT